MEGVKDMLQSLGLWLYSLSTVQGQSAAIFQDTPEHRNRIALQKALEGLERPQVIPAEVSSCRREQTTANRATCVVALVGVIGVVGV